MSLASVVQLLVTTKRSLIYFVVFSSGHCLATPCQRTPFTLQVKVTLYLRFDDDDDNNGFYCAGSPSSAVHHKQLCRSMPPLCSLSPLSVCPPLRRPARVAAAESFFTAHQSHPPFLLPPNHHFKSHFSSLPSPCPCKHAST